MNEEKIITELLEVKEAVNNCVKTQDFDVFKDNVLKGQDQMITILKRLDEERTFTLDRVRQLEGDVKAIKLRLAIA